MLIVMQDNPDPDAIAAAVALRKLANTLAEVQCSIAHGGTVGRGENRAMVKYLGLNLRAMDQIDPALFELFALVDTQPCTGNNSLPANIEPDIVIDHHPCRRTTRQCRFTDIRNHYGASVTILYEYFKNAEIKIDVPLATAMLYAIRSDTQDLGRDTSRADVLALTELYTIGNKRMLSQIQRGLVQRDYFQMLSDALKKAKAYGNAIVTNLGEIENPDMVAEVADLLLRDEMTDWVMVCGLNRDKLMISLRTEQESSCPPTKSYAVWLPAKAPAAAIRAMPADRSVSEGLSPKQIEKLVKLITTRFVRAVAPQGAKPENLIQH